MSALLDSDLRTTRTARTSPGSLRRQVQDLRNGHPLSRHELVERWEWVSSERFGAFDGPDGASFRQLPLKVAAVRLSDPLGLVRDLPAVAGVGIGGATAGEQAMLNALAAYGSLVVDPRTLLDVDGTPFGFRRRRNASDLLARIRNSDVTPYTRAIDLTTGRERLIPATAVYPALSTFGAISAPCGASAALDWQEALTHGLLQHCVRLTVAGTPAPDRFRSVLDPEKLTGEFAEDHTIAFLLAMARAAALDLALYDVTGPIGVPVVACVLGGRGRVFGGGANLVVAVREALMAAVFRYQLSNDRALKAAIAGHGHELRTSRDDLASVDPRALVDTLTSLGRTPAVVVPDNDPAVSDAFPYVLRVALVWNGAHPSVSS